MTASAIRADTREDRLDLDDARHRDRHLARRPPTIAGISEVTREPLKLGPLDRYGGLQGSGIHGGGA